jgi:hypothetical protein
MLSLRFMTSTPTPPPSPLKKTELLFIQKISNRNEALLMDRTPLSWLEYAVH